MGWTGDLWEGIKALPRNAVGNHGILNPNGDNFAGLGTIQNAINGDAGKIPGVNPGEVRDIPAGRTHTSQLFGADSHRALQGQIRNATNGGAAAPVIARAGVDRAQQFEGGARQAQMFALGGVGNAAMGNAPSVAQAQQAQGLDAAIRSQAALANSARGTPAARAAAMRGAGVNTAGMQQQAVNNAAALRAGEIATARGQLVDAAGQLRTSDQATVGQESQLAMGDAGNAITTLGLNQENTRGLLGLGLQSDVAAETARQGAAGIVQEDDRIRLERDLGILGNNTQRLVPAAATAAQQRGGTLSAVSGLLGGLGVPGFGGGK